MKKLNHAQVTKLADLLDKMRTAEDAVRTALSEYNILLDQIGELRDEVAEAQQAHIEKHSEKWQDSEVGQAYDAWRCTWANLVLEPLDEPDLYVGDVLEDDLTDAPEEV